MGSGPEALFPKNITLGVASFAASIGSTEASAGVFLPVDGGKRFMQCLRDHRRATFPNAPESE